MTWFLLLLAFVAMGILVFYVAKVADKRLWQYPTIDQPNRKD